MSDETIQEKLKEILAILKEIQESSDGYWVERIINEVKRNIN